ncbi:hypothetical protein SNARM312S_02773 [Streptomyces narbonensis]
MHPFRISRANARRVPALGAAVFLALGLFAPQTQAASAGAPTPARTTSPGAAAPAPRSIPVPKSPDAMSNSSRFRISAQDSTEESGPAPAPKATSAKSGKRSSAAVADECPDLGGVVNATGSALVQQLKALPRINCTYPLFNLTGENARKAFHEAQMVTVANALRDASATYAGNNNASIGQLVLFLRAGYYVQDNNAAVVGDYGTALDTSARGALDAFFASPRSKDVTDANGEILNEVVTLIDSTHTAGRYAGIVKWMLGSYDGTWPGQMNLSMQHVEWVVENGFKAKNDGRGWRAALKADPTILDTWAGFITRNGAQLNRLDVVSNVGRHLGHALDVPELKDRLRPLLKDLINRYPNVGPTAPITMNLGWSTRQYDRGNCAAYAIWRAGASACSRRSCRSSTSRNAGPEDPRPGHVARSAVERPVQPDQPGQPTSTGSSATRARSPVDREHQTVPRSSSSTNYTQYALYAWAIYNIDVDNGGMYERGQPGGRGQPGPLHRPRGPLAAPGLPDPEPPPRVPPTYSSTASPGHGRQPYELPRAGPRIVQPSAPPGTCSSVRGGPAEADGTVPPTRPPAARTHRARPTSPRAQPLPTGTQTRERRDVAPRPRRHHHDAHAASVPHRDATPRKNRPCRRGRSASRDRGPAARAAGPGVPPDPRSSRPGTEAGMRRGPWRPRGGRPGPCPDQRVCPHVALSAGDRRHRELLLGPHVLARRPVPGAPAVREGRHQLEPPSPSSVSAARRT